MKLSIVSIIINITEGLNHSSVIRAAIIRAFSISTREKKRKKKNSPLSTFICLQNSSISRKCHCKHQYILGIADNWMQNRLRPRERTPISMTIVWTESESMETAGKTKSRVTTQSPRDAIRVSSLGASAYRERRAVEFRASGQSAYLSICVCLPYRVPLFRRAFRAGDRGPRPRVAGRVSRTKMG